MSSFKKGCLVRPISTSVPGYRALTETERRSWYIRYGNQLDSAGESVLAPRYTIRDLEKDRVYTVARGRCAWKWTASRGRISGNPGCTIICTHTGEELWVQRNHLEVAE